MNNVPIIISLLFIAVTLFTAWMFYTASGKSKTALIYILVWVLFQTVISLTGFYQVSGSIPPRFVLLIGPGLILTLLLFTTQWGKNFVDSLNLKQLTLLHSVRVPVEITLYFIYVAGLIPALMTYEGNNLDILSGITAPIIFYLVFVIKKVNKTGLLVWNFLCLALLINVLVIAVLSAQTPFQKLAFEHPNIGVTFFPFTWLPSVVVPIVLISHLAAIRQLLNRKRN